MTTVTTTRLLALALAACLPGLALAAPPGKCGKDTLYGRYVFTASGFTRASAATPGTPWVPKAIVEVIHFDGNGGVATPLLAVANPFGDSGAVLQPPQGAPGEYTLNPDCSGTLHFFDANNATFTFFVELPGNTIHMIQTFPANNVFQGTAVKAR